MVFLSRKAQLLPSQHSLTSVKQGNTWRETLKNITMTLGDTAKFYHNLFIYDIKDIKSAGIYKTLARPHVSARQFFLSVYNVLCGHDEKSWERLNQ